MEVWLLCLALIFGTLVSEDLSCVVAGGLVAEGQLTPLQGVMACMTGILLGDVGLYAAGKYLGRPALKRIPLRWMVREEKLQTAEEWFKERGPGSVFISRFLPGTRLPIFVSAGLLGMSFKGFFWRLAIGALLWTPALVGLSMVMAETVIAGLTWGRNIILWGLPLAGLGYFFLTRILPNLKTWEGRRRLVGQFRRLIRPEYWPVYCFYTPVTLYLFLRRLLPGNRLLDFTSCNPCMPAGGVVGESKSDILNLIGDTSALPPFVVLPEQENVDLKVNLLETFRQEHSLDWPIVLKPDEGQRGEGVMIAHGPEAVHDTLQKDGLWIAQAYVPGREFGVFMMRDPERNNWEVFDITVKKLSVVTGNGTDTVRKLILKDDRAVCQADHFLHTLKGQLDHVPCDGEELLLSPLGNHCRGSEFRWGGHLITEALSRRMSEICNTIPEFHYGRFDIKVPSEDHLQRGEDIQIIELNGVTSEATGLYDRRHSYLKMVSILLKQWRRACAIGKANRLRGHDPVPIRELIHDYEAYRHKKRSESHRASKEKVCLN